MSPDQAKQCLSLYRPHAGDATNPEFAEALRVTSQDPALQSWFENHCQATAHLHLKLNQIQPPPDLKQSILAQTPPIRLNAWWRQPSRLAAAAAVLILLGISAVLWFSSPEGSDLDQFRLRMVKTALKQYDRMDLETSRMEVLRQFFTRAGTPADYLVPPGLAQTSLTGGKALLWRNHPVSMVCFDRGDRQMLFLFVVNRNATPDFPPPTGLATNRVSKLLTATWTQDHLAYLLAGPEESRFTEKYLRPSQP